MSSLIAQLFKVLALICNGLFISYAVIWVLLICIESDDGDLGIRLCQWWSTLAAAAAVVIVAHLMPNTTKAPFVLAASGASVFLMIAALWTWWEYFEMHSELFPTFDALALAVLSILSLVSLLLNCPIRLDLLIGKWESRVLAIAIIVFGIIAGFTATPLVQRVRNQWPDAMHIRRLGGTVYWEMGNVSRVFLSGSSVTDDELSYLVSFPQITYLVLDKTRITENGLKYISSLTNLEILEFRETGVTDEGLGFLSGLNKLKHLCLQHAQITDDGLVNLMGLSEMRTLTLDNTGVTDAGLVHLYDLRKLRDLSLVGTRVTDDALHAIAAAIPTLRVSNGHYTVEPVRD
jgi:hypothetical protein